MGQSATARLIGFLINTILFGGMMFLYYHFAEKLPAGPAVQKAAIAGVIFGSLNLIFRALLNRKNKS